jgi:hypothetical protein
MSHLFWWSLSWACVIWYSTLTFYVAWKGVREIRVMLKALKPPPHSTPTDRGERAPSKLD